MNIGIIGAGFTGLTAGYHLQKKGHKVTLFEKDEKPGGLAIGFQKQGWAWSLEKHYHHIFTSDTAIRGLATEIGVPFEFKRPNTSSLVEGDILQLDSPLKLLQFSKLTLLERVRMGAVLGYLRYIADWRQLEQYRAHEWLSAKLGTVPYGTLWEPLLAAKFGPYYKDISLAWFWARIKARTTELGYPEGGFQHLAETLAQRITKQGGAIRYHTGITRIEASEGQVQVEGEETSQSYDALLVTVPNILFSRMAPALPASYKEKLHAFKGIGAVNMVLELDGPFLPDGVYWLNICEKEYPFLAVVEHTNFIDKKHYHNHHLLYVGNYLPHDHRYFRMSEEELMIEYAPYLEKLHSHFQKSIMSATVFKVPFAQPIVTRNFSQQILPFKTPLQGVYLANMQQVYPWDRGTNFAVEMGIKVANLIGGA